MRKWLWWRDGFLSYSVNTGVNEFHSIVVSELARKGVPCSAIAGEATPEQSAAAIRVAEEKNGIALGDLFPGEPPHSKE